MRVTAETHVKLVSWLLGVVGMGHLLCGVLVSGANVVGASRAAGMAGRWLAVALLVSGVMALYAGLRNSRRRGWAEGLVALLSLGATGLLSQHLLSPYAVIMAYGLLVYLAPSGRRVFKTAARPGDGGAGGGSREGEGAVEQGHEPDNPQDVQR